VKRLQSSKGGKNERSAWCNKVKEGERSIDREAGIRGELHQWGKLCRGRGQLSLHVKEKSKGAFKVMGGSGRGKWRETPGGGEEQSTPKWDPKFLVGRKKKSSKRERLIHG